MMFSARYTTLSPLYRGGNLGAKKVDNKWKRGVMMCDSHFHLSLFPFPHTVFKSARYLAHFHLADAHVKRIHIDMLLTILGSFMLGLNPSEY